MDTYGWSILLCFAGHLQESLVCILLHIWPCPEVLRFYDRKNYGKCYCPLVRVVSLPRFSNNWPFLATTVLTTLFRQYIVKLGLHESIKIMENVFKSLSFLDNGRRMIPMRNFCSTALFTEMNKNSLNYASFSKKQNSRHDQCPVVFWFGFVWFCAFVWVFLFGLFGFFFLFLFHY